MPIIGRGLLARALLQSGGESPDVTVFAAGVSDSRCLDRAEFARELYALRGGLALARQNGTRFVYFTGGGAIYGHWEHPMAEGDRLQPTTMYGVHQKVCEELVTRADVGYVILRLPNVVGPTGNRAQLIPNLVDQAVTGHIRVLGSASRDLLDVNDMAAVTLELLRRFGGSGVFNVATGHSMPVPEIAAVICSILGVRPTIEVVSGGEPQVFDVRRLRGALGRDPFDGPRYAAKVLERYVPDLAAVRM